MEKGTILRMGSDDIFMVNASPSDFLIEASGRRGFDPIQGRTNLIYRLFINRKRHWSWGVLPRNKEKT
jgi:hypothetical protein